MSLDMSTAAFVFDEIVLRLSFPDSASALAERLTALSWPADKTLVHTIQG